MRAWLRRRWLDVRMGVCSGFPNCCIAFFVTVWPLVRYLGGTWPYSRLANRRFGEPGPGYVPCPLCLLSRARVLVRKCTDECGHIEESRRMVLEKNPDATFR